MKKLLMLLTIAALMTYGGGIAWPALTFAAIWQVPGDFPTIQGAIDNVLVINGDTIRVAPGEHAGATVTKSVEIKGEGGSIINDGPLHVRSGLIQGFRLQEGNDGATISHFTFKVDLAIMNGDAIDDVTVTQNIFQNAIQAISNWRGNRWGISLNKIYDLRTLCGGGIGILVADYSGGMVTDNVVSHNTVVGTLHVSSGDCGDYDGSGIVIFADFRWGREGASKISGNRVVKNRVSLVSDTPAVVDVNAFELTQCGDGGGWPAGCATVCKDLVVTGNPIGFNDFRGTTKQILLTPSNLEDCNDIDRNLGNNRGQGSHPSIFGPGGN